MPRQSLRKQFREDPALTAAALAGTLAIYAAVGVVRPRWLTAYARHPVRNAALSTLWRTAARTMLPRWTAWLERNRRAQEELLAELGREPTPEEQIARMEELAGQELT